MIFTLIWIVLVLCMGCIRYALYNVLSLDEPNLLQVLYLGVVILFLITLMFNLLNSQNNLMTFNQRMILSISSYRLLMLLGYLTLFWYLKPFYLIFNYIGSADKNLSSGSNNSILDKSNIDDLPYRIIINNSDISKLNNIKPLSDFYPRKILEVNLLTIKSSLKKLFIDNFISEYFYSETYYKNMLNNKSFTVKVNYSTTLLKPTSIINSDSDKVMSICKFYVPELKTICILENNNVSDNKDQLLPQPIQDIVDSLLCSLKTVNFEKLINSVNPDITYLDDVLINPMDWDKEYINNVVKHNVLESANVIVNVMPSGRFLNIHDLDYTQNLDIARLALKSRLEYNLINTEERISIYQSVRGIEPISDLTLEILQHYLLTEYPGRFTLQVDNRGSETLYYTEDPEIGNIAALPEHIIDLITENCIIESIINIPVPELVPFQYNYPQMDNQMEIEMHDPMHNLMERGMHNPMHSLTQIPDHLQIIPHQMQMMHNQMQTMSRPAHFVNQNSNQYGQAIYYPYAINDNSGENTGLSRNPLTGIPLNPNSYTGNTLVRNPFTGSIINPNLLIRNEMNQNITRQNELSSQYINEDYDNELN